MLHELMVDGDGSMPWNVVESEVLKQHEHSSHSLFVAKHTMKVTMLNINLISWLLVLTTIAPHVLASTPSRSSRWSSMRQFANSTETKDAVGGNRGLFRFKPRWAKGKPAGSEIDDPNEPQNASPERDETKSNSTNLDKFTRGQNKSDLSGSSNVGETSEGEDNSRVSPSNQKRGRGPFGFFKPREDLQKKGPRTKDENDKLEKGDDKTLQASSTNLTATSLPSDAVSNKTSEEAPANAAKNGTSPSNTSLTFPESLAFQRPRYVMLAKPPTYPQHQMIPNFAPVDNQRLILAGVSGALAAVSRLWLLVWLAKRLTEEDELVLPRQHFRWECLNDRYSKDESIFNRVIATPSRGFSRLHWSKYLKSLRPKGKVPLATKGPVLPSKNVIVVDIAPSGQIDVEYITDVVNFLLAAHSKLQFGEYPEIVLLVESPGGGVSKFGLAAAQVGRLRQTGLNVTVCVDEIAASGGYMIASQATKLLAAPFAQLGSIGVMLEGLNFNKLLTKYGVTPMVLKAGESKNRLSAFGEVTQADLEDETKRLESIHQAFIDMCLAQRPELDPSICDGTVMVASQGIQHGIVDRVLTSEEYIWESIANGAHVLKLRRASDVHPNFALFQVLNLLPHLKQKLRKLETGKLLSVAIQGVALVQMILQSRR